MDNSASVHFTAFIHRCIPNRVFLWITTETSTRAFFRKIGHITRKTGPVRGAGGHGDGKPRPATSRTRCGDSVNETDEATDARTA